jgi:hypothetical protein
LQRRACGDLVPLAKKAAFEAYLKPLRNIDWVVYAKEPFAGPRQVLRYLSRYTHRVAISNRRLISADANGVTFRYKDYRIEGPDRYKTMTLATDEFIRRFLLHVLPKRFHRIRHYGLLASGNRAANLAHTRKLLAVPPPQPQPRSVEITFSQAGAPGLLIQWGFGRQTKKLAPPMTAPNKAHQIGPRSRRKIQLSKGTAPEQVIVIVEKEHGFAIVLLSAAFDMQ